MRHKIAVFGAGNVGGTTAFLASLNALGDVILVETEEREGIAKGKALDIQQSCALSNRDVTIRGTSDISDIAGADICVITAGLPRSPGMSRDDLLSANMRIIESISAGISKYASNSVVIVVSNPVDVLSLATSVFTGFPPGRVMGMAGVLDSARLRSQVAAAVRCSIKDIRALVLGGHGDTMVPVMSYCTVNGIPVGQLLDADTISQIVDRTRFGGGEIVDLMGTSAYYAAASSILEMVESILRNQQRLMPCSVYVAGEYGLNGIFIGLPAILGSSGIERIVTIDLGETELEMLMQSAEKIRELAGCSSTLSVARVAGRG